MWEYMWNLGITETRDPLQLCYSKYVCAMSVVFCDISCLSLHSAPQASASLMVSNIIHRSPKQRKMEQLWFVDVLVFHFCRLGGFTLQFLVY